MVLSDRLRERLVELDDADLVEVVVELHDHDGGEHCDGADALQHLGQAAYVRGLAERRA